MTWKLLGVALIAVFLSNQTTCPRIHRNLALSATNLQFNPQTATQGSNVSAAQTVTITNTGNAAVTIPSITASGYYLEKDNCPLSPATLAVGASCSINISFTPSEIGDFSGVVTIADNAIGAPHLVSLSGSGVPPVGFDPSNLDFGSISIGSSATQTVTLTNNQATALGFHGLSASGNYAATADCPSSVPAGGTCKISVTFAPTAVGSIPGAVTASNDALPGMQPIGVSGAGKGSASSNLHISLPALDFGKQEAGSTTDAKSITLTNTNSSATLSIVGVTPSSSVYHLATDTCSGQTLAAAHSCSFSLTFHPLSDFAPISYPGAVTITDSEETSPHVIGVSGMGVPPITTSPASVAFGNLVAGASSPTQTVKLTNQDSAAETISPISVAGDFTLSADSNTCTNPVPVAGTCSFQMTFNPRRLGPSTGAATITPSNGGFLSPQVVNLSGCQTDIAISPGSLNFGMENVGVTSDLEIVTVTNGDANSLNISGTSIGGSDPGEFTVSNSTCGASLAPGASCTVDLAFTPGATGRRTAVFNINDDGYCSPQSINLIGGDPGPYLLTTTTMGTGTGAIISSPAGITCGSAGSNCSANYNSGTSVTLTAAPDPGNDFVGWGGACSGVGSCILEMKADKQVTANFTGALVTISKSGSGTGTITSSPPGISCGSACSATFPAGSTVTLTETADQGSVFDGWGGVCTGTAGSCNVTITQNQTVNATFDIPSFSLATSNPTPQSVTPGQSSNVTLTVASQAGFSSAVGLSCSVQSSVSKAPTCSIKPSSVTPAAGGSVSASLTINTMGPTLALASPSSPAPLYALYLPISGLALVGVGAASGSFRKRIRAGLVLGAVLMAAILVQNACGGGGTSTQQQQQQQPGTPAGSYTVTITAVSGGLQQVTSVTLNVQ